jgi:hypothetical protein
MRYLLVSLAISAMALALAACAKSTPAAKIEPPKGLTAAASEPIRGTTALQMDAANLATNPVAVEYQATADACVQQVLHNPTYIPLKSKTVIDDTQEYSFIMQHNWTHPNQEEITLLSRLYGDYLECRKLFMDGVLVSRPTSLNALTENYSKFDKLWTEATAGKLSWGEFNRGRIDLGIERLALLNQTRDIAPTTGPAPMRY